MANNKHKVMVNTTSRGTSETHIMRPVGLLRVATITKFYPEFFSVDVSFGNTSVGPARSQVKNVQLPVSFMGASGAFIGGYPDPGTNVIVAQGEGNTWFVVGFLPIDQSIKSKPTLDIPEITKGHLTVRVDDNNSIDLDSSSGISIGEPNNSLILDTGRFIFSNTFDNKYSFTEAARGIDGSILRDTAPNVNLASSLRASDLSYNDTLNTIAMDPLDRPNWSNESGSIKNPIRTETREVVYEYAKSFNVVSNDKELNSYKDSKDVDSTSIYNRRESRADTLSLSLLAPNYLMEVIKGTVVDIYGNILDLNRSILPFGQTDNLSVSNIKNTANNPDDGSNVFLNIKRLERRSIAYHFELNARKDTLAPPNVIDKSVAQRNYGRDRSRFYFDVDKEGQFKLNVPSSSETGNIALLTRYENYSTVFPNSKTNDPNDLVFNGNNMDILLDSFITNGNNTITLIDAQDAYAAPLDRFSSGTHIKHGTAYHNISKTVSSFQNLGISSNEYQPTTSVGLGRVPFISNIISPVITLSGQNANAGGRSGQINMDGMLELNLGANTIDRDSLWIDFQGAVKGNVGRDLNNGISMAVACDGEILIQSGGTTPDNDTRFTGKNTAHISGVVDIRVFNDNTSEVTIFRIDREGLTVSTPGRVTYYSNGNMTFRSKGTINIEAPTVNIQNREVNRDPGAGSI